MKILISWVAYQHDFIRDKETGSFKGIDKEGTNYNMHKYFFEDEKHAPKYMKHVLLYSNRGDETGAELLRNSIMADFKGREIEIVNMQIKDPIDLSEIKPKVESKLMGYSKDEIDIFVSPGTPAMYLAWYICHTSLGLNTRLLQTRPAKFTKTKVPELLTIDVEKSHTPITAVIREQLLDQPKDESDYILTETIKPIYHKALLLSQFDSTVIIFGETGTGKEHLAKYIHNSSTRKGKAYETINCSAFNDQLLESRLFGYKKGSFTGAEKDTPGLFERAEGGTIFLDEIGDISSYMQQSLLRVLQDKEIQPIGGRSKKVNVRIISATNKNLSNLCKEGKFRLDLYYRLVVNELELPTLQDRGTPELEEMIDFFVRKKKKELKRPNILKFTPEVRQFMLNYSWPGNVRELENLIETLYVFCDKEVSLNEIPTRFKVADKEISLNWKDVEKAHIIKVLKLKKWNQLQACKALGYKSINTLRARIRDYKIEME